MHNLMITHGGALGDNGFTISALTELKKRYDEIYLYCRQQSVTALKDTRLIDRFIVRTSEVDKWYLEEQRRWLSSETRDIDFQARLNFNGVVPGRYMFHESDPKSSYSLEWKRKNAEGVNFFDAFCERAETPEAVGRRPEIHLTHKERSWLRDFRYIYGIPMDAFLLGWQFTGSAKIKWYPYFDEVIQRNIMQKYPHVYVVGLGDLDNQIKWDYRCHKGRFINPGNSISFRQAYILTSIMDCFVSPETGVFVFSQAFGNVPKVLLATHTTGEHICCGDETIIIQSEAECAPCYNIVFDCKRDGDNPWSLCMGKIPPGKVIAAIEKVMGDT